ncbi:MAG: cellulase family glycosylhydrolase [Sphingomonadaceae bacterium]
MEEGLRLLKRLRWVLILALVAGVWWWLMVGAPSPRRIVDRRPPAPTQCIADPAPVPPAVDAEGRPLNYLHSCGSRLYDSNGREVRITGLNWFGMETGTFVPHGLWSRNWKGILDQIARLGYNAIRIPLSNEALVPGQMPQGINYQVNPDLAGLTSLEVLDLIVQGAGERGLKVVLDRHRPTSAGQSDLWYTDEVSEDRWIADWVMLAQRYRANDTVIGVDLHNEPKGPATWGTGDPATDWRIAAEKAGNAVLEANPYLLILVQGVEQYGGDWYWWGGNLTGARDHPVQLAQPGRLVYSAHDYGPGVYWQGWFSSPDFPRNLPWVWRSHWGYLQEEGIAPVIVGEFGGRSVDLTDAEGVWQRSLLDYLQGTGVSYFAWSLNPNSGDTGGLLGDDWLTVVSDKQQVYREYLAPPLAEPRQGQSGPTSDGRLELLYRANETSPKTNSISFALQIVDRDGQPLDLTRFEVRYWFSHGSRPSEPQVEVDFAALGEDRVKAELVRTEKGRQDHYLKVTFPGQDNVLPPYGSTGDILLRIHASDWSQFDQANDHSFWPEATGYRVSDRITVYEDGKLVWGREPQ